MSLRSLNWAFKASVSNSNCRLVLVDLAERHNPDGKSKGEIFCSQATIAERTKLSERTVRSTLSLLEKKGFISRKKRSVNGQRITDLITLNVDLAIVDTHLQPKNKAPRNVANQVPLGEMDEALRLLTYETPPAESDRNHRQNESESTGTICRETSLVEPVQRKNPYDRYVVPVDIPDPNNPESFRYNTLASLIERILNELDGTLVNPEKLFPIADLSPLMHWLEYDPDYVVSRVGAIARWRQAKQKDPIRSWRFFDQVLSKSVRPSVVTNEGEGIGGAT